MTTQQTPATEQVHDIDNIADLARDSLMDDLPAVDAWWRACNYLTVGQIYLQDNPLSAATAGGRPTSSHGFSVIGERARGCRSSTRMPPV